MRRGFAAVVVTIAGLLAACGSSGASSGTGSTAVRPADPAGSSTDELLAGRTFQVVVPRSYDGAAAVPLVVLLHGYTSSGTEIETWLGMARLADERGFVEVRPDGSIDADGNRFWNATDACCNSMGSTVDDSAFLTALIGHVEARYRIDLRRVYVVGHSNGGFMAHRMACDHSDLVAAIVSIAGATWADRTRCSPSHPVSVLQVHGTDDATVPYAGGTIAAEFPGAAATTSMWASYDGCAAPPAPVAAGASAARTLDLDVHLAGDDTVVSTAAGCPAGVSVDLWSIVGAGHVPTPTAGFTAAIVDWLLAHPRA